MASEKSATSPLPPSYPSYAAAPVHVVPSSSSSKTYFPSFMSPLGEAYNRFSNWRAALALPNPGSVENLQKEVKNTHLTNFFFDGARADLTKGFSMEPMFQVTHSFSLASQTAPSMYNFGAIFANASTLLTGHVDHEGSVNARLNQGWSSTHFTKVQAQLSNTAGQNMIQLEQDYGGQDFNLNLKAINPSPVDGNGIYVGSYLQSITKNLALGVESIYQRQVPQQVDVTTQYVAKLTGTQRDWIATATLQPAGMLLATYWHRLSEKVEAAAELQVIAAPARRDAIATLGAKYDLRMSTFRAQVDSTGKVSALLEQRFAPTFTFTVAGEIDHFKNAAKVGVGVAIESTTLTPEEMGMTLPPGAAYP